MASVGSPRGASRALLLLVASSLAACGARSALREGVGTEEATGGGGPGGAGPGGMGGAGGQGGAQPLCALTVADPIAFLPGGEGFHQRRPDLALTSSDLARVTLASGWGVTDFPDPPQALRHTSFYPWDGWPEDGALGSSYLADLDGGGSFGLASSQDERFSLAFIRPGEGLYFSPSFIAGSGETPGVFLFDSVVERALFNVAGEAEHLVGAEFQRFPPNVGYQLVFYSIEDSPFNGNAYLLGCSDRPMVADGTRVGDRWMFAFSTGAPSPFTTCFDDTPSLPPTKTQIVWATDVIETTGIGQELGSDAPPVRVQMAPLSDGAWMVVADESPPAYIYAIRMNRDGFFETGELILATSATPGAFGADAVADWLALAWVDAAQQIQVGLFERDGVMFNAASIPTSGQVIGPPSVIGWPNGLGLLVAWSEAQPGGGDRVRVARLDCRGG